MRFQDQTVKHNPPEAWGDCFRTTIANLLDLDVTDVPHVLHDNCQMDVAICRLNAFLRQYNLAFIAIGVGQEFLQSIGIHGLYHEGCGRTIRNTEHSAAFCDGELVHDPHPSHVGFTSINNIIGIFVVLNPADCVNKQKVFNSNN